MLRIAAHISLEYLCGMSVRKFKLFVSSTVYVFYMPLVFTTCICVCYRHVYVLHVCVYYMHMCGLHTFPLHNVHCSARLPIFSFFVVESLIIITGNIVTPRRSVRMLTILPFCVFCLITYIELVGLLYYNFQMV